MESKQIILNNYLINQVANIKGINYTHNETKSPPIIVLLCKIIYVC